MLSPMQTTGSRGSADISDFSCAASVCPYLRNPLGNSNRQLAAWLNSSFALHYLGSRSGHTRGVLGQQELVYQVQ